MLVMQPFQRRRALLPGEALLPCLVREQFQFRQAWHEGAELADRQPAACGQALAALGEWARRRGGMAGLRGTVGEDVADVGAGAVATFQIAFGCQLVVGGEHGIAPQLHGLGQRAASGQYAAASQPALAYQFAQLAVELSRQVFAVVARQPRPQVIGYPIIVQSGSVRMREVELFS